MYKTIKLIVCAAVLAATSSGTTSYAVIDGYNLIAKTQDQYTAVTNTVEVIAGLKRKRARKQLDYQGYTIAVKKLLKRLSTQGITVR